MIVCLGWGSLIWNPEDLPIELGWHTDGPQLPVEFARVSDDGRLTLVITEGATPITVLWSSLAVDSLDDGIQALAGRENIPQLSIGSSIGIWSPTRSSHHAEVDVIGTWASQRVLPAVIWTGLKPGFPNDRGRVLTCEEALAHLRSLYGETKVRAEEYIRRTPINVRTPYRDAIEDEFGWTPI